MNYREVPGSGCGGKGTGYKVQGIQPFEGWIPFLEVPIYQNYYPLPESFLIFKINF